MGTQLYGYTSGDGTKGSALSEVTITQDSDKNRLDVSSKTVNGFTEDEAKAWRMEMLTTQGSILKELKKLNLQIANMTDCQMDNIIIG